ncbi:MAG: hypothetical protein EXR79_05805 [Myxococcales bacterium]|nr:hypothetical protein [Myxococcales bacterium]
MKFSSIRGVGALLVCACVGAAAAQVGGVGVAQAAEPKSAVAPKSAAAPLARPVGATAPDPVAPVAAPSAPSPTAAPEPPLASGKLVVTADADGLVLEIRAAGADSRVVGLKSGENPVDLASGSVHVVVKTAAGQLLNDSQIAVPAGGEVRLSAISTGQLVVDAADGAFVEVDGKVMAKKDGKVGGSFTAGPHTLVVQHNGFYGRKGPVEVPTGRTATVKPDLEAFVVDTGTKSTVGWVGILGGGALVVTAVALDVFRGKETTGGDTMRWALVGVGAAGFIGGTVMVKQAMDAAAEAPVKDGTWNVVVGRRNGGGEVRLGWRF